MSENTEYLARHVIEGQEEIPLSSIPERDYLEHYQIKGAKHGVRRFQNYDGSLTPEGRIRYGVGEARKKKTEESKKEQKQQKKKEISEEERAKKREVFKEYLRKHPKQLPRYADNLSREEANEIIEKIDFDRKLKQIRDQEVQAGWKKVQDISNNINTASTFINNTKNLYNNGAEIYNTLIDAGVIKDAAKLPKVGGGPVEKDRKEVKKFLKKASAEEVLERFDELTADEQKEWLNSAKNRESVYGYTAKGKAEKEKKEAENAKKGNDSSVKAGSFADLIAKGKYEEAAQKYPDETEEFLKTINSN